MQELLGYQGEVTKRIEHRYAALAARGCRIRMRMHPGGVVSFYAY